MDDWWGVDAEPAGSCGLVTHSLLARAHAALARPDALTLPGFFDLCGLFEAVVLTDEVRVIKSVDEVPDTEIFRELGRRGVLKEFTLDISAAHLSRAISRLPHPISSRVVPDHITDTDRAGLADGSVAFSEFLEATRPSLDTVVDEIDRVPTYPSVRPDNVRQRVYRSYAYLVAAGLYGMDYFPDHERAPFVAGFIDQIYRSLPVELYQRIAASIRSTMEPADLLSGWVLRDTIPIPPISSLVLHRSASIADIPAQLLAARSEFEGYRRHFSGLKRNLREADDVQGRRKIMLKYQRLLAAASGPAPEKISVSEVLNLGEKVVKAAGAPLLPTSYSALLLTQPIEWIQRWWRRRPLSILFRLDGKLPRITEYEALIGKLWGEERAGRIREDYPAVALQTGRLMQSFDADG